MATPAYSLTLTAKFEAVALVTVTALTGWAFNAYHSSMRVFVPALYPVGPRTHPFWAESVIPDSPEVCDPTATAATNACPAAVVIGTVTLVAAAAPPVACFTNETPDAGGHAAVAAEIDGRLDTFPAASLASTATVYVVPQDSPVKV